MDESRSTLETWSRYRVNARQKSRADLFRSSFHPVPLLFRFGARQTRINTRGDCFAKNQFTFNVQYPPLFVRLSSRIKWTRRCRFLNAQSATLFFCNDVKYLTCRGRPGENYLKRPWQFGDFLFRSCVASSRNKSRPMDAKINYQRSRRLFVSFETSGRSLLRA